MSELRRLLRYEIPGLAIIIHVVLVSFIFLSFDECLELIGYLGKFAAAIALLSLFIGWLAFQVFEELCQPRRNTRSFKLIQKYFKNINFNISDDCCFAIGDYLLTEDMYIKYPGLADTFRGYWDHYYSRRIIGLGIPLVSILTFIILACLNIINDLDIWRLCDVGIPFTLTMHIIFLYPIILKLLHLPHFLYILFLLLYNIKIYDLLENKSARIFLEIECQEYLFIQDNINKLDGEKFNPFLRADLDRQDPP